MGKRWSSLSPNSGRDRPVPPRKSSGELDYRFRILNSGQWRLTIRLLPTWPSGRKDKPGSIAVAFGDNQPRLLQLPSSLNEFDPQWQQDVLRNAAVVTMTAPLAEGVHVLRVWSCVDPGVVLDAFLLERLGGGTPAGCMSGRTRRGFPRRPSQGP